MDEENAHIYHMMKKQTRKSLKQHHTTKKEQHESTQHTVEIDIRFHRYQLIVQSKFGIDTSGNIPTK